MQEESVDDNLSYLEKDIKYCLESKKGHLMVHIHGVGLQVNVHN